MHIARLKFPAPATEETWVTSQDGEPVVHGDRRAVGLPRRRAAPVCLPQLRQVMGQGRRVTVCFDRGGWSPALFADITAAGFDLLTWRKGPAPGIGAEAFTTITCADDRGRAHACDLAGTTITLAVSDGPRKGQTVPLRQVTAPRARPRGGTRQIHALTSRTDLAAGEVCWRLTSPVAGGELLPLRPHLVRAGRPGLPRRHARRPEPESPEPGEEKPLPPGPPRRDPRRRGPGPARRQPGSPAQPPARRAGHHHHQMINALDTPAEAAWAGFQTAQDAGPPSPPASAWARSPPDMVRLEGRGQADHPRHPDGGPITPRTTLARTLNGHYARARDEHTR